MCLRSFKKSAYVLLCAQVFLSFTTFIWNEMPLITPPQVSSFSYNIETTVPMIILVFCSFVLPNSFETELALTCGMSTVRLAFSKFIPIITYIFSSTVITVILYRYTPYDIEKYGYKPEIPIYVPENFKLYTIVSLLVTEFFFFALFCLFRVITRNCYLPVAVGLFVHIMLVMFSDGVRSSVKDIRYCYFDPFISTYFVGNEIPNAYAEQVNGMEIMKNAWMYNRIGFFVLGTILLFITYLFLRGEKLHRSFSD